MVNVRSVLGQCLALAVFFLLCINGEYPDGKTQAPPVYIEVYPGKVWRKEEIPNPQVDVYVCGNEGQRAWICNPDAVLTSDEARQINKEIEQLMSVTGACQCPLPPPPPGQDGSEGSKNGCPGTSGYAGWHGGVAIVNKIGLSSTPTVKERNRIAAEYTAYMREESWQLGRCGDDLIVLASKEDKMVYTSVGKVMSAILTPDCVSQIDSLVWSDQPRNESIGRGLINMLHQYTRVLHSMHECNGAARHTDNLPHIIIVALTVAAIACMVFIVLFLQQRYKLGKHCSRKSRKSGDSSGNYVAAYRASPKSSPNTSPKRLLQPSVERQQNAAEDGKIP